MLIRFSIVEVFLIGALSAAPTVTAAEQPVDFQKQIAPIFEQHCVRCHSPGNNKGELSLATFDNLQENEYVIAGKADESYLLEVVTANDGDPPAMPKEGDPLSDDDVELLRRWISEGADWPSDVIVRERSRADSSWWSLQPLADVEPPVSESIPAAWNINPIDWFVYAKLAEQGLQPNPPADRRSLIRRATYDLLGLPPSPEEVDAFVSDPDPQAYEQLIERLLDSPHYGERWGRHWLDVVRFGESNGFEKNTVINTLWPFRDYVIQSINDDKPFDRFIREHLAGDVFGGDDPNVAVGTAFLVAGPYDDVGNQDAEQIAQIRANTLDEMINSTGQAFLGMTLGCARCHDHKFDPITQRDYYAMYATFAGVRHGNTPLATPQARSERTALLKPLNKRKAELEKAQDDLKEKILKRAHDRLDHYEAIWPRPPVDRTGTEETFEPVVAKFVRLVCEAQDINPQATVFRVDEFEIWSAESKPRNVALATNGGRATGEARKIEDFPGAYGPQHAIDGKTGARFISTTPYLTIELAEPTPINRVLFSSARGEQTPEHSKFVFVADYRIEVSDDGTSWREVAHGRDRRPVGNKPDRPRSKAEPPTHRDHRLLHLETTDEERRQQAQLSRELNTVKREITRVPELPDVWIGTRNRDDAQGPFHVFLGGSPQKKGELVVPASLSPLNNVAPKYQLPGDVDESARRNKLANWITDPNNPLTPRVLANRVWHYHFGTGIVDTPNDFGYMGGRPTHPELLDFLARQLQQNGWRLKAMHRLIMTSQTYRQSSKFRDGAAAVDGDSRLLWRYPPRRLSAEEIRDTILSIAGKLDQTMGGPGFRLYHFMQDNVCTYVPLDKHGPETYRRAVYHQNARASVVDLMTEFDQPDCAFSTPHRAQTTSPLQALTMLNHSFTLDMARDLAERLQREAGKNRRRQIARAYELCYSRKPTADEISACRQLIREHNLVALCRVLLNTSELIYVQ